MMTSIAEGGLDTEPAGLITAQQAFVKLLDVRGKSFLYDVNKDAFFAVSPQVAQVFRDGRKADLTETELADALKDIEACASSGALSSSRPENCRFPHAPECYNSLVDNAIEQIILNISDNCNMRCHYCIFSGLNENVRSHDDTDMSQDIVAKAIDYYVAHSTAVDIPTMGLYGGEPLLRMPLVKFAINRFIEKLGGRNYMVSLTTNGLGLTPDVWEFFHDKNVSLLVSVDGPADMHDRYRKQVNGKDSFALIEKNLRWGAEHFPEFYRQQLTFSTTLAPPYDLKARQKFFEEWPLKNSRSQTVGYVDGIPLSEFVDPEYLMEANEADEMFGEYVEALIRGEKGSWLQRSLFQASFLRFFKRQRASGSYKTVYPNTCRPGIRRLYVDSAGTLHLCEKVSQTAPIGDVFNGINKSKAYKMAEDFATGIEDSCRNCWASRYCQMCFIHTMEDRFDPSERAAHCQGVRNNIEQTMMAYCYILSENPKAFDHFKEISFG